MAEVYDRAVSEHVDAIAFGDLFLQDVRAYRETQLKPTGLEPLFPLWELPTAALAREMIAGGLRAKLACVDSKQLPESFAGREFDTALLRDMPPGSTRVVSAASFISVSMTGQCSPLQCRWRLERSSTGMGSCTQISNSATPPPPPPPSCNDNDCQTTLSLHQSGSKSGSKSKRRNTCLG